LKNNTAALRNFSENAKKKKEKIQKFPFLKSNFKPFASIVLRLFVFFYKKLSVIGHCIRALVGKTWPP
jgi:hypothetical protein